MMAWLGRRLYAAALYQATLHLQDHIMHQRKLIEQLQERLDLVCRQLEACSATNIDLHRLVQQLSARAS